MRAYRPSRLGILRLSAIGDVVHAMPLAMGLRRAFPKASITWVVQAKAAPLLADHPAVDELVLFPRRGGPGAWIEFVRRLRACRFDATVDPQGNLKSGLVGWLSGCPLRAGLHPLDCREWGNILFTNRQGRPARGPHGVDRAWAAGAPLGLAAGADEWGLHASRAERREWFERCRALGADPAGRLLAMNLTHAEDIRSWFADAWAQTARRAVAAGFQVLLNGRASARGLAAGMAGEQVFDLTGRDDLRGLLAQFECMATRPHNLLLSPDSGPIHMAAAVGLPVVCLSGPQDPRRTGPRRGGLAVHAWEGLACAPCRKRRCVRRPPDRACMRQLTAERVLAAVAELLGFLGNDFVERAPKPLG